MTQICDSRFEIALAILSATNIGRQQLADVETVLERIDSKIAITVEVESKDVALTGVIRAVNELREDQGIQVKAVPCVHPDLPAKLEIHRRP